MSIAMIEKTLQYTHLEKLYGYLPGMKAALPAILGLDQETYDSMVARFSERAREAAKTLLADETFAAKVDALPFQPGQTVLVVGDSITDDLQSYAEILRHLLDIRLPGNDITVHNGGLSAHTTAMVLRRWVPTLNIQPDWIVCLLGGNDVTRIGAEPNKTQVELAESVANLRELRRIAAERTQASWIWLTPVPVHEERMATFQPFHQGLSSWSNADIMALAEEIKHFEEPVVDLTAVFHPSARPELQGDDGVHPSLAGQAAIAKAFIETLTEEPR